MQNQFSFEKGWGQVKQKDAAELRAKIMKALNLTTTQSFRLRARGLVEPKASEKIEIENIFREYGIKNIWGL